MAPTSARSLEALIGEAAFLPLLSERAKSFYLLANFVREALNGERSKNVYGHLMLEANALESFLDDYGARNNRTYGAYSELVASIRNFARVGHSLSHLLIRLPRYELERSPSGERGFVRRCRETLGFCNEAIRRLLEQLYQESRSLGLVIPQEMVPQDGLREPRRRLHLPNDADEGDVQDEERRAAEFIARVVHQVELLERIGIRRIRDYEGLRRFVEAQCDEEKARKYESIVHSLQSKYDTFLKGAPTEARHPELKSLRGQISVALHLLESVTDLVHFYERHENEVRSGEARMLVAGLIDKKKILDRLVNFGLVEALQFLLRAKSLAQTLLPTFLRITHIEVQLPAGVRLHARPASLIVAIVGRYGTPVTMRIGDQEANARSIMQVMMLAGSTRGAEKIEFRGDGRPLKDLDLLFRSGLGEKGLATLPPELHYLQESGHPR